MADPEPLFEPEDAATFTPTELARGPWSPHALHGGPVAALLLHLAEGLPQPGPMHPARVTVELLRPVPLAPLRGEASLIRPATVLWIRRAGLPLPDERAEGPVTLPPPAEGAPRTRPAWQGATRAYHSHAVEHRVVRGVWGEVGPCIDWIRLRVPLVRGAAPSPLARVAAAADFGNGISSALPYGAWRFINPDLTIHLQRLPEGEWVCLDAATWTGDEGVGLAESELFDARGRLGRSLQSLLLEKAPQAPEATSRDHAAPKGQ
jgi:hypothetical protein